MNYKYHGTEHDKELFEKTFENALNGIDPDSLTEIDLDAHEKWVNENWDDLNPD